MANPTSNFNWQMPTPTDLVTDLPADFEVFGQAVDSSMADLLGGTTGQILAKNSNTDMDFVWIANDQGDITGITASSPLTGGGTSGAVTVGIQDGTTAQKGAVQLENSTSSTSTTTAAVPASVKSAYDLANGAIPKSLIDAAGDLIVGTAADTAGRLGIGTANQVLKVNSGATALEWGTAAGGGDLVLINTTSFSGVSSQSVNDVFSATYDNYLIKLNETTGGVYVHLRLRVSGTDATSGYRKQNLQVDGTATYAARTTTDTAMNNIAYLGAGYNDSAEFNLQNPFNSNNTSANGIWTTASGAGIEVNLAAWGINNTTSYTGFTLVLSSGTMTGSVSVYGYKK